MEISLGYVAQSFLYSSFSGFGGFICSYGQYFMQEFSVEGVNQMGSGPIFKGRIEILLSGRGLKFRVIFQKCALKLIKI